MDTCQINIKIHNLNLLCLTVLCIFRPRESSFRMKQSVRACAGKTRLIIYKNQQVETMKCKSNISQKNLFFENIITVRDFDEKTRQDK